MQRRRAITLIEVIVVLIIISIGVLIAVPNFRTAVYERSRDKEAVAVLRLIQAGERIYRIEQNPAQFFPWDTYGVQNTAAINRYLRLSLILQNQNWDYSVTEQGSSDNFRVRAIRLNPPANFDREWIINSEDCNANFGAYCTGNGCPNNSNNNLGCPYP